MSGPPYPKPGGAGSNAIGSFVIGVSPIGDLPSFDFWTTVISQYANSPRITQLVSDFFDCVDQTANFQAFFDLVWNVDTAQGYGLDVWGRIVDVGRVLQLASQPYFGFSEGNGDPFGQSAFYNDESLTTNFRLEDDAYRKLVVTKAVANISDGSIPSINQILLDLFPNRGNCYVTEGQQVGSFFGFAESHNVGTFGEQSFYAGSGIATMQMTYTFEFVLSPVELAIVQQSGVLPRPAGVSATVVQKI